MKAGITGYVVWAAATTLRPEVETARTAATIEAELIPDWNLLLRLRRRCCLWSRRGSCRLSTVASPVRGHNREEHIGDESQDRETEDNDCPARAWPSRVIA